jgi:hypothetical protein
MLRYSRDLPIAKFFAYSAWLMAILTVVLAGKGVSALQEAGIVGIAPLAGGIRVSMLGIFPTLQSTGRSTPDAHRGARRLHSQSAPCRGGNPLMQPAQNCARIRQVKVRHNILWPPRAYSC